MTYVLIKVFQVVYISVTTLKKWKFFFAFLESFVFE